ncbi:paired amphipathic helix protein Sin3-like protein 2 isoform X3, partial [Tanacetum coccineum]
FELDMLLESVNSALKRVEELLNDINNRSVSSEGSIRIEDHFFALNLCCIERLYGDHGLEVMETLRKSHLLRRFHVDLFKIIKYLCEEVCSTKEQVNQVLKLWTTFLEPMLYVPSRPGNSDNVEDVEISTRGATRNEGESDGSPGADSVTFNNVKQGKPACNGDDNVLPKRVDSSKGLLLVKWVVPLPKEAGSRVDNRCVFVEPVLWILLQGRDATPRPRNVHDDGHEAKSNIDDVPPSQQGDTSRTPPVANGNFAKFEKEEGELSPNVYFDEADLAAYGDHNGSDAKAKHSMEIDADADDEDSKNVLEGGDDVSAVKTWLESEKDIRLGDWKAVEIEILNVFQLLTAKPVVYLVKPFVF